MDFIKNLRYFIFLLLAVVLLPIKSSVAGQDEFKLFLQYYREKNFPMVKNLAKDLIDVPQLKYHVKSILAEVYFQENDFYYAEELLKGLVSEFPEKGDEIQKKLDRLEKERNFISRKNSDSNRKFIIFWREGQEKDEEMISRISSIADEAYISLGRFFGWYPEEVVQILLYYGTDYNNFTSLPPWSQGGYDGKIRLMIRKNLFQNQLREIIFHEYTHLVIHGITKGNCPLWLNEAIAQYFSIKYGSREITYEVPKMGYKDFPIKWSALSDKEVEKLYKNSLMLLLDILQNTDETVITAILENLGSNEKFETAFQKALSIYGLDVKDFMSKRGDL